jgi:hypothetical protein
VFSKYSAALNSYNEEIETLVEQKSFASAIFVILFVKPKNMC